MYNERPFLRSEVGAYWLILWNTRDLEKFTREFFTNTRDLGKFTREYPPFTGESLAVLDSCSPIPGHIFIAGSQPINHV